MRLSTWLTSQCSILFLFLCFSSSVFAVQDWLYSSSVEDSEHYLNHSDIVGVQILYPWRSLEPEQDQYDFSQIENDIRNISAHGKKLWIQIQDRSFSLANNPVPRYLQGQPLYSNGSVQQCDGNDCAANFTASGWVASQWNPGVRQRFHLLLKNIAEHFDGRIYGMNFPETAIEVNETANGFTSHGYFHGTLENARYAREVFQRSYVVQYINFWPDGYANENNYISDSFEFLKRHHIGIGGPDDIPYHPAQENNTYPYMNKYRDELPISVIAVQEPDLQQINPKTNTTFTREEFTSFAVN